MGDELALMSSRQGSGICKNFIIRIVRGECQRNAMTMMFMLMFFIIVMIVVASP